MEWRSVSPTLKPRYVSSNVPMNVSTKVYSQTNIPMNMSTTVPRNVSTKIFTPVNVPRNVSTKMYFGSAPPMTSSEIPILQEEITHIEKYFSETCGADTDKNFCTLNLNTLNDIWPDKKVVRAAICSFRRLFTGNTTPAPNLPSLDFKFFENSETITDIVYKITTISGIKLVIKSDVNSGRLDYILHEYLAGLLISRLDSPVFTLVIGAFSCFGGRLAPCSGTGKSANFIMYQYVRDSEEIANLAHSDNLKTFGLNHLTLDKYIDSLSPEECFYIVVAVYYAAWEAYRKIGFIHQDLHFSNIMIVKLDKPYKIKLDNRVFVLQYFPKIIDYGRTQVRIKNKIYSPVMPEFGYPAKSPIFDLTYMLSNFCSAYGYPWYSNIIEPIRQSEDVTDYIDATLAVTRISEEDNLQIYKDMYTRFFKEKSSENVPWITMDSSNITGSGQTCQKMK